MARRVSRLTPLEVALCRTPRFDDPGQNIDDRSRSAGAARVPGTKRPSLARRPEGSSRRGPRCGMSFLNKSNTAQRIAVPAPPRSSKVRALPPSTISAGLGSITRIAARRMRRPRRLWLGRPALPRRTRSRASSPSISPARAESPSPIASCDGMRLARTRFVLDK